METKYNRQAVSALPLKDEELLASLGYKQQLKRDFSWIELIGLSFSMIGCVQSIASVLVYSLPNGGAVAMIWGWAVCCFFLMMVALSMAELASAAPTSGGLYYWTFQFSSKRYRRLLSWIVGYSNGIQYISNFAGSEYATVLQMYAAVTIASGGSFVPTQGQIFALFCAQVVFHVVLSSLATKFIARLQLLYMALNILVFIALVVALPVATPAKFKNSAKYVFGDFSNLTLWPSGFAFVLSFLAPTWTVDSIDAGVHMSEEARNASVAVPRTIIVSAAMGCVFGWIFNIVIAFNMGTDTESILSNPIGQPMATIIFNSLGLRGTLVVWSLIIVLMHIACMDVLIAGSRQTFAFARDGALPFAKQLYKINSYTGTPVLCVLFCGLASLPFGLLSFAGPAAVGAIFTLGIVCQNIAYTIPLAARHLGGQGFIPGPFSLGRLSGPITFLGITFMILMNVVFMFPTDVGPTAATMNYTVVIAGGILGLSIAYYFFPVYGGINWFRGPVRNIDDLDIGSVSEKVEIQIE